MFQKTNKLKKTFKKLKMFIYIHIYIYILFIFYFFKLPCLPLKSSGTPKWRCISRFENHFSGWINDWLKHEWVAHPMDKVHIPLVCSFLFVKKQTLISHLFLWTPSNPNIYSVSSWMNDVKCEWKFPSETTIHSGDNIAITWK